MSYKKVDPKSDFPKMEEEILAYWDANDIFKKSVEKAAPKGDFVFFDGPPFATGTPHYGHIVASAIKDAVPRYFTMRGYRVERKWGWDCHGLPIENIAEKELGIRHKKEIEELGVAKFNDICRSKVLEYAEDWKKVMHRFGRWADMEDAYKTMDRDYMESVWWVFKELWDKGLVYEDYRSMHICPRCETTLSQQEVSEGYKDVKDLSVIAKFELVDTPTPHPAEPGSSPQAGEQGTKTYVLAWTTTPWTLPGNVALAVGEDIEYVKARYWSRKWDVDGKPIFENFIIAGKKFDEVKNRLGNLIPRIEEGCEIPSDPDPKIIETFKGNKLVGESYRPLFSYLKDIIVDKKTPTSLKVQGSNESVAPQFAVCEDSRSGERSTKIFEGAKEREKFDEDGTAYRIYAADFVTTEDGTGVVHIAPAFGEDDMALGKKYDLPFVQHVSIDGRFNEDVVYHNDNLYDLLTDKQESSDSKWIGIKVKDKDDPQYADIQIIRYLAKENLLFSKEKFEHSYPHCWRCDTPLLNYATSSWFIRVTELKDRAIALAKNIHWSPEHVKTGRFGKWLEGARDWSISRQRYWASVMPIWKCECGEMRVFGLVAELEEASGRTVDDLHKHVVDPITVPCEKCEGVMHRIPDVLDTWFDSGSMPYAQAHYPFEGKESFDSRFPADFIAEGIDQTRAWFYYLHVMATGLRNSIAYRNVIVNGIVLAEDGLKMSKKLKNYPDPMQVLEKHGSDALRLYLLSSPIVSAENLNFSERELSESTRNLFRMLWNSYSFFTTYASIDGWEPKEHREPSADTLDRWILSELQVLIRDIDAAMEAYDLQKASRLFMPFVDDLSNTYIRENRSRFWKSEDDTDKENAYATLHEVLVTLAKLMAPFTPFIAEEIYRNLTGEESVHLSNWPESKESLIDIDLMEEFEVRSKIKTAALYARKRREKEIKQPLPEMRVYIENGKLRRELLDSLESELNVKHVVLVDKRSLVDNLDENWETIIAVPQMSITGSLKFDDPEAKPQITVENNTGQAIHVSLNTEVTPQLTLEGEMRKIIRAIQEGRKKAGFEVSDRITLGIVGKEKVFDGDASEGLSGFGEEIARETLATEIVRGDIADADYRDTTDIEGEAFSFSLRKIR